MHAHARVCVLVYVRTYIHTYIHACMRAKKNIEFDVLHTCHVCMVVHFEQWSNEHSINYRASTPSIKRAIEYSKITIMYVSVFPIPHIYFVHQRQMYALHVRSH